MKHLTGLLFAFSCVLSQPVAAEHEKYHDIFEVGIQTKYAHRIAGCDSLVMAKEIFSAYESGGEPVARAVFLKYNRQLNAQGNKKCGAVKGRITITRLYSTVNVDRSGEEMIEVSLVEFVLAKIPGLPLYCALPRKVRVR